MVGFCLAQEKMPVHDGDRTIRASLLAHEEITAPRRSPLHATPLMRTSPARNRARVGLYCEAALVAAILALALALRFWNLTVIPFGLHGDEAVAGLEGQRILREGNIGPYTSEALGQPAGPLYVMALSVKLFGNTIFAVRAVAALAGALTVLALYIVMRRSFGPATALIGAALLATMSWHVHFARIGFPLETWPLCIILTAGAVVEAIRRNDWRWWLAAGFLAGIGVYSYNAHPLFIAILALFIACSASYGLARHGREGAARRLLGPLAMAIAIVITALPLIAYARVPEHEYFSHARAFSIFRRAEWTSLQTESEWALFLGDRYRAYWDRVCCHPEVDAADGTGLTPLAPAGLLLLAGFGALIGVRRRHPLALLGVFVVLLIPWASVITIDGLARRTFAAALFLALLGALPLGWLVDRGMARWRTAHRGGRTSAMLLCGLALALLVGLGPYTLHQYFRAFANSQEQDWIFNADYYGAIELMQTLPEESYIYFVAERWPLDHEMRLYLAPHIRGEDRSEDYGQRTDLLRSEDEPTAVFILFGRYTTLIDALREQYPDGTVIRGHHNGKETFVAYRIDGASSSGQVP